MITLELDTDIINKKISGKSQIKYSFLEKIVLHDFVKGLLEKSLKNEGYMNDDVDDFVDSYLETFNTNKLINI